MTAVSLAVIIALLAAVVLASGDAEARGGGGRGGGGGGKPSSSPSKPSAGSSSAEKGGAPPGVANPSSPYYGSPNYGIRHGALSNFFLWSWLFHDHDDDEYEEEYIQSNTNLEGWALSGLGVLGVWFLIRNLRRRFGG